MTLGRVKGFTCPAEVSPDCQGHSWADKFTDCVTSALYGAVDAETGSVDGWGLWVGLVIQTDPVELPGAHGPVFIPGDTYRLISEDSDGRIVVATFETAAGAQQGFDDLDDAYGGYRRGMEDHAVDMREKHITSSTGRIGR